jgi:hypothetical protein
MLTEIKILISSKILVFSPRNLKSKRGSLFLNKSEKTLLPLPFESTSTSRNKTS